MSTFTKMLLAAGGIVFTTACASEKMVIERPSHHNIIVNTYAENSLVSGLSTSSLDTTMVVGDTLSFEQALSKTLLENPQLQSYAWQVRVKEAERIQASLLPNPELESELENFGGTGPFEGMESRETTVRLSQKILLGADRMKNKRLAGLNRELAGWDYEAQRLTILTDLTKAYITALEAQQQWQQQKALLKTAEQFFETVSAQTEAGKVSGLERTKARIELSRAHIDMQKMQNKMKAAFGALASYWKSDRPEFNILSGSLNTQENDVPAYEIVAGKLSQNPDIARWATEIQQRKATLLLEKAKGIPDVTLNGGYKHVTDVDAGAAMVGISIPIPFFNRNQGNVKAAQYRMNRAEAEQQAIQSDIKRALQESYYALEVAEYEVRQLKMNVLPGAEQAYEAAQTGYSQGKFGLLDVLDAQRTFFSSRTRYIEALAEYHHAIADVERLIGIPLTDIPLTQ